MMNLLIMRSARCDAKAFLWITITAVISMLAGCGGGGAASGGGGVQHLPAPDFSVSLTSTGLSIAPGGTASTTVTASWSDNTNSAINVQISGLPTGVTCTPTNFQFTPATPQQITVTVASTVVPGTTNITVNATSGSLSHSAQLALTITLPQTATFRTRYTRTDAVTEYFLDVNENWMVYDPVTNRFFVSDPNGNRIMVLNATTEAEVATIIVPGAYGIDETPDHSVLYAGTQIGDVYAINPVTMQITHRYAAAQIGSNGFLAYSMRALSSGKLALLGAPGGSIPSVDGYSDVAVWNPANNSITVYGGSSFCVGGIGVFTVTGDRSLVVVGSIDSDGTLCTLNPTTGQYHSVASGREFLYSVTPTPDGKSLLVPIGTTSEVAVYNAQTLALTTTFPVSGDTTSGASMIVSPDSTTLYMNGVEEGFIYAYNIATGALRGWLPNLAVKASSGGTLVGPWVNPNLQAFDNTGLLAGPMEEGVGFLDTATLRTGPVGSEFLGGPSAYASASYGGSLTASSGPAAGGTATSTTGDWEVLSASGTLSSVYIGGKLATSYSAVGTGTNSSSGFYATTPANVPGPADWYALMSDGGMQIIPEAFSYGPTILEVSPNVSTAEGGGTGYVYGYGFGPTAVNAPIPTDLQVTVGGKSATITGYSGDATGLVYPPSELEAIAYTVPPGTAGTSASVTVTSTSGSTTAVGALSYLPPIQQYSLPGASLARGIYDAKRNVYYFTDQSQVDVFSLERGWLTPIQFPAPPYTYQTHRLWGIALSPDGDHLAISDRGTELIYLLDPDSPGSVQSLSTPAYHSGTPIEANPSGLAVNDSGMIYYVAVGGDDSFFKLNSSTGQVTDYLNADGPFYPLYGAPSYLDRVAITSDNSTVFFNNEGQVFSIDTATDKASAVVGRCCLGDYELTLSADNSTLEATGTLFDQELNRNSYLSVNDREALNISYLYGAQLSANGSLLFQPSTLGIDVIDGRLGTLIKRIALPVPVSQIYDALVGDGKDNVLIAITEQNNAIAVIDLNSIAEPAPLPYAGAQPQLDAAPLRDRNESTSEQELQQKPDARTFQRNPLSAIKHITNDGTDSGGGAKSAVIIGN